MAQGESTTLEFKRSTGELRDAMRTVGAFLNGCGGIVLFGIRPDGRIEGQQITDLTLRDFAQNLSRFEPPVMLEPVRLKASVDLEVLMVRVLPAEDSIPFVMDGRAYERVASTTQTVDTTQRAEGR